MIECNEGRCNINGTLKEIPRIRNGNSCEVHKIYIHLKGITK